jgi:hypothetical protein
MTMLAAVLRMLVGLFVDDGSLALAIIVIVLLSWVFATLMPDFQTRRWRRASGRLPWRAPSQCHQSGRAVVQRVFDKMLIMGGVLLEVAIVRFGSKPDEAGMYQRRRLYSH